MSFQKNSEGGGWGGGVISDPKNCCIFSVYWGKVWPWNGVKSFLEKSATKNSKIRAKGGNDRLGVFLETYPYWGAEVSLKGKYVDSDSAVTVADWQCLQQSGCRQFLYWHSSILGCLSALLSTLIINTYYQHLPSLVPLTTRYPTPRIALLICLSKTFLSPSDVCTYLMTC